MSQNKNIFDRFVDFLNNVENSIVNLIAKIVPILVPLIPAYVSYNHVKNELFFSTFFAFTYASVVEGLGYASIYRALQFWEWNRRFKKEEKKSPFWLALAIYITYLFVILWVNVMLDWQTGIVWYRIVAIAAISLLSVPAGLLISISAIHTERVKEHDEMIQQLKDARDEAKKQKEEEKREQRERELRDNNSNPQPQETPKKLSKSQQAYNYVAEYYNQYHDIPTNKIVSQNTGVAVGTSFAAIESFVLDHEEELLQNGIIKLEHLEKIKNKKGASSTTPIGDFINSSGRFPNQQELNGMNISVEQAAKFIVGNSQTLIQNGILREEDVEQANKYLTD